MAKRRKVLPTRPPIEATTEEHSLLFRSAESLGRVIGALQRQLDDATRRLTASRSNDSTARTRSNGANGAGRTHAKKTKTSKTTLPAARRSTGARKKAKTGTRSKRTGR